MTTPRKEKKREARREEKAEKAAVLDKVIFPVMQLKYMNDIFSIALSITVFIVFLLQSIEKELLERLKKGVYGDIYNYPADKYNEILDKEQLAASDLEDD